jgi:hypothetical protein
VPGYGWSGPGWNSLRVGLWATTDGLDQHNGWMEMLTGFVQKRVQQILYRHQMTGTAERLSWGMATQHPPPIFYSVNNTVLLENVEATEHGTALHLFASLDIDKRSLSS